MQQYHDLCKHILDKGIVKDDRTGTGTISTFGYQMRFDLSEGFPLMTTKDMGGVRLDGIIHELLWFLNGDTNIKYLVDNGVNIWNPDAYRFYSETWNGKLTRQEYIQNIKDTDYKLEIGDLGPIYGKQWRSWKVEDCYDYNGDVYYTETIDQTYNVIEQIKKNPTTSRLIASAW